MLASPSCNSLEFTTTCTNKAALLFWPNGASSFTGVRDFLLFELVARFLAQSGRNWSADNQAVTPIIPSPSLKRRVLPVPVRNEPVVTVDDVKSDQPGLNKLSEVLKLARKGLEPEIIKVSFGGTFSLRRQKTFCLPLCCLKAEVIFLSDFSTSFTLKIF